MVELNTRSCVKSEILKFVVEGDGFAGQPAIYHREIHLQIRNLNNSDFNDIIQTDQPAIDR